MAFRAVSVVQIKEVLRRWLKGEGERPIGRGIGVDRRTALKRSWLRSRRPWRVDTCEQRRLARSPWVDASAQVKDEAGCRASSLSRLMRIDKATDALEVAGRRSALDQPRERSRDPDQRITRAGERDDLKVDVALGALSDSERLFALLRVTGKCPVGEAECVISVNHRDDATWGDDGDRP